MNWKRIIWPILIILMASTIWGFLSLRENRRKIANMKSERGDSAESLVSLQKRISSQKGYMEELERIALWPDHADAMSWLTGQAEDSDVQVVGVEYPSTEKASSYQSISINLSVRGGYDPLGVFINKLERSQNAIRINSLRMKCKESTPEQITMDIGISCIRR